MKRRGVINQPLSQALAGLGHGDCFLLCDAGFPIPKDVERIDLALSFNVPSMQQCLKAILDEIVVQKVIYAAEMPELNADGAAFVRQTFQNQEVVQVPQSELVELAQKAKFIVCSGELGCYSNILMEAASGVEQFKRSLVIDL